MGWGTLRPRIRPFVLRGPAGCAAARPNFQSSRRPLPRGRGRRGSLRAAPGQYRGPPGLGAGHREGGDGGGERAGGGAGGGGGGGAVQGWERRVATAKGLTRVPARAQRRTHCQGTQASGGSLGAPPPQRSAPSVAGKRLGGPRPASPLSRSRRGPSPACRPRGAQAAAGASLVRAGAGRASRVCRAPR